MKPKRQVRGIRGRGLMLGIEIETSGLIGGMLEHDLSAIIVSELLNKHDILTACCDRDAKVLRFEPPLAITRNQIDTAVEALDKVLSRGKASLMASFGMTAARSIAGRRNR